MQRDMKHLTTVSNRQLNKVDVLNFWNQMDHIKEQLPGIAQQMITWTYNPIWTHNLLISSPDLSASLHQATLTCAIPQQAPARG